MANIKDIMLFAINTEEQLKWQNIAICFYEKKHKDFSIIYFDKEEIFKEEKIYKPINECTKKLIVCPVCQGERYINEKIYDGNENYLIEKIQKTKCPTCKGKGFVCPEYKIEKLKTSAIHNTVIFILKNNINIKNMKILYTGILEINDIFLMNEIQIKEIYLLVEPENKIKELLKMFNISYNLIN